MRRTQVVAAKRTADKLDAVLSRLPRVGLPIAMAVLFVTAVLCAFMCAMLVSSYSARDEAIDAILEGSSRQTYGFEAFLQAQITERGNRDTKPLQSWLKAVRSAVRQRLGAAPTGDPAIPIPRGTRMAEHELIERLAALIGADDLAPITEQSLGLELAQPGGIAFFRTENDGKRITFGHDYVVAPRHLVEPSGTSHGLSKTAKRDVLFTALISEVMLYGDDASGRASLDQLEHTHDVSLAYVIPLSGSIRFVDQVEVVATEPWRPETSSIYFAETLKKAQEGPEPLECRVGEPYLDHAGAGIVQTISILVRHPTRELAAVICLDQRLGETTWDEIDFNQIPFTPWLSAMESGVDTEGAPHSALPRNIATEMRSGVKDVRRWEHEGDTIFTIPLGDDRFGFVRIEPGKRRDRTIIIGISATLVMLLVLSAGLYTWWLHRSAKIALAELEIQVASRFIHMMSHALKTPLQGILLAADRIRRRSESAIAKQDAYFSMLERHVNDLKNLSNDILTFSGIELGFIEPRLERIDAARLVRAAVKAIQTRQSKQVELGSDASGSLNWVMDPKMTRIILDNMIGNAVKYTDDGHIWVIIERRYGKLRLVVADTGIGISDSDRRQVFDLYFRSEDPDVRSREGIGLGMYITRRYVELHDGTVDCLTNDKAVELLSGRQHSDQAKTAFVVELPELVLPDEPEGADDAD